LYIKEHVKLHILLGGGTFPWSSWLVGAGLCEISHRNLEIFGFGGTICTHRSIHRPAMDMGVGAYSRACPTIYSIMRSTFFKGILAIWCRGLGVSHRNFEIFSRETNFGGEQ
jgi:hypothetical protein